MRDSVQNVALRFALSTPFAVNRADGIRDARTVLRTSVLPLRQIANGGAYAHSVVSAPLEVAAVISKEEVQMLSTLHVMLWVEASRLAGVALVQASEAARLVLFYRTTPSA